MSRTLQLGRIRITLDWPRLDVSRASPAAEPAPKEQDAWNALGGVLRKKGYRFGDRHGEPQETFEGMRVSVLRARRTAEMVSDETLDGQDVWLGQLDRSTLPGKWLLHAHGPEAAEELQPWVSLVAARNGIELLVVYGNDPKGRLYSSAPAAPPDF